MFSLHGLIHRTWGRDFFQAGALLLNPRSIFSHQWFLYLGGFFLHPGRSCFLVPVCAHQCVRFEFFTSHFCKSFSRSGVNLNLFSQHGKGSTLSRNWQNQAPKNCMLVNICITKVLTLLTKFKFYVRNFKCRNELWDNTFKNAWGGATGSLMTLMKVKYSVSQCHICPMSKVRW
jgi:hypothetical protein